MSEPLTIPASLDGERIDRVVALLSGRSRAEVTELIAAGAVRIGGDTVVLRSRHVEAGESIELDFPPVAAVQVLRAAPVGSVPFDVIYEDEFLIVVDKPPGVVVHPGAGHELDTLAAGLLARFPDLAGAALAGAGEPNRPGIVHRLDKDTSGLLVVARTPEAYRVLVAQLAERTMGRGYVALAVGHLAAENGRIEAPIGRSARSRTKMAVSASGREAATIYSVSRRFSGPVPLSLLDLRLETGRTHQIHVHLAAIGHPVAGDRRYGGRVAELDLARPFLHAARLRLAHPNGGEQLEFTSPLPADLVGVVDSLR